MLTASLNLNICGVDYTTKIIKNTTDVLNKKISFLFDQYVKLFLALFRSNDSLKTKDISVATPSDSSTKLASEIGNSTIASPLALTAYEVESETSIYEADETIKGSIN